MTYFRHLHTNTSHPWAGMMTRNRPNLSNEGLEPPTQPGASKGLLHNRNSPAGLIRWFFSCGHAEKDRAEAREARPPLFALRAEPSCLTHIHSFTIVLRFYNVVEKHVTILLLIPNKIYTNLSILSLHTPCGLF